MAFRSQVFVCGVVIFEEVSVEAGKYNYFILIVPTHFFGQS